MLVIADNIQFVGLSTLFTQVLQHKHDSRQSDRRRVQAAAPQRREKGTLVGVPTHLLQNLHRPKT